MLLFVFYVPVEKAEEVKQALFSLGAGEHGKYSQCCFESLGRGQFLPQQGAKPYWGEVGKVEKVQELKVEMLVKKTFKKAAIMELKKVHPYEEPAYHFIAVEIG